MKVKILLIHLVMIIGACAKVPQYAPSVYIEDSFAIRSVDSNADKVDKSDKSGPTLTVNMDRAKISVEKSALEKEFLLQAELVPQGLAPQFRGLESRIVSFRRRGDSLYMLETAKGHNFAENIPQTLLLAEFPITAETTDQIEFDFNQGMSHLFVAADWKAGDFGGNSLNPNPSSLKTRVSYLEEAKFSSANKLFIRQVALVEVPQLDGSLTQSSMEVFYSLSPYFENPSFVPTELPDDFEQVGFFEISPIINKDSGLTKFATKMDIKKPIVYAISANTPAEYKQAIKDGILYWNRAFGKDVITVEDAPVDISAPSFDHNVVQWVEWDSAGFAYADAQMDPRSGEILHQQIYFTSAWAKIGQIRARRLAQQALGNTIQRVGLAGFKFQNLCDMDLNQEIMDQLESTAFTDLSPVQQLKAAQDLLREVVAHEVGHTLGLRHNFAGSLAANYSLNDRDEMFKQYLKDGHTSKDLVVSSSVMDYQFPLESILNGDQISQGFAAGEYDRKAIQILYYGAEYSKDEMPLFCTDSHARLQNIPDCKPYDAGSSLVAWTGYSMRSQLKYLPREILATYQNAKAPLFGRRAVPIEKLGLDAESKAGSILAVEVSFMGLFPENAQLLSIMRSFPFANSSNSVEIREKTEQYLVGEIAKAKGMKEIFLQVDNGFADREYARFEALLQDPNSLKGTTDSGKPFEFSGAEVLVIKKNIKNFYKALQAELIKKEAEILAGGKTDKKMKEGELADLLAAYLAERAEKLMMDSTKEPLIIKKASGGTAWGTGASDPVVSNSTVTTYTLPSFVYPFEVRKLASTFLRADRSESLNWAYAQRLALNKKYTDMVNTAFPTAAAAAGGATSIDKDQSFADAPLALIQWLKEAKAVGAGL